ncbi:MAG TPA: SrfA family protein [Reyranella sp.]|nr:SrfA family protein [Reyranella sp.]
MAGPLLSSEPLQRYRALGLAGDPVWRAARQLRAAITQRLSAEHADLLAIPEVDPSGRSIDWYAPFDGEVRRLADLGDAERAAVQDKVRRLHEGLVGLAVSMEEPTRSGAERNFARLLRHALTAPGEETLYVVDGKPVMTFWGFSADAALPGVFLPTAPPAPPPPPAAAIPRAVMASMPAAAMMAAPGTRSTWWQWLLLALLLLLLLAGLAWVLRPYLPHLEPRLEAEARDRALAFSVHQPTELQQVRFTTLQQDNEQLRLELAKLTDEVARKGGDCAAGVLLPGGVVVGSGAPIERSAGPDDKAAGVSVAEKANEKGPSDKSPNGDKSPSGDKSPNLDDKNAKGPDDKGPDGKGPGGPDKAMADKNGADKNGADKNNAKKDEPKPMVVPPEAKQKQDLAFMKGDWRSRTGLVTASGEKDIRPSYTLDDKGKGKVSFTQQNGTTCEAPAEARWDSGKLMIEEKSNPKCTDGRTYARNTVNCEVDKDGVAQCKGSQPGDKRSYNVQIGR